MLTADDLVAAARDRIREIPAENLASLTQTSPVLIDVREPAEFAQGHLAGAINVPRGLLEFKIHSLPALSNYPTEKPTSRAMIPIVVYCQTGGRAALAAESLQQLGFREVQSLAGGLTAWKDANLPLFAD